MAKKLPKQPKKPKKSSGPAVWERYDVKMRDWNKKCADIKKAHAKKESIIKKYA